MGTGHLDHLLADSIDSHNRKRPHPALDFATPMSGKAPEARDGPVVAGTIRRHERLGGVIKHYTRMAARVKSARKHDGRRATGCLTRTECDFGRRSRGCWGDWSFRDPRKTVRTRR